MLEYNCDNLVDVCVFGHDTLTMLFLHSQSFNSKSLLTTVEFNNNVDDPSVVESTETHYPRVVHAEGPVRSVLAVL